MKGLFTCLILLQVLTLSAQQVQADSLYEFYSVVCKGKYAYADVLSTNEYKSCQDSLRNVIQLELLKPDAVPEPIPNPYQINTEQVQRDISTNDWRNDFFLPIDGGKDSIRIKDYDGEGYISMQYVGQLEPLDAYVINAEYEEPSHRLIDRTTGEIRWFTTGVPFISPDGKRIIDFCQPMTYDQDYACAFVVHTWDEAEQMDRILSASFSHWLPVQGPRAAWWASNEELIMQVYPVSSMQSDRNGSPNHDGKKNYPIQYMRVQLKH